ncbi:serine hydrolase domain-containing protein [Psychrobacter urativorans]|uniref:serine hydrolase domain-containing protein n=1 Tax=Psychrobacter urativorans TaxID=45610 RepID=UPI00191859A8|nr:serine hydrolase [Psychrobacter urativorans]
MLNSLKRSFILLPLTLAIGLTGMSAHADNAPLTVKESDPQVMGWMQGFPPPDDKLISQPSSNFFSFPKLRWSVCHMRALLPTTEISRGIGAPSSLDYNLDKNIDAITFTPTNSKQKMTWRQSLDANYTDGIMVMHHGKVVYERQNGCLNELGNHAAMSMTKSLTGLLAETLVTEGKLDDSALVGTIIPELKDSGFGDATVRQVMDMTTALDYSEEYDDPDSDIWKYAKASNPLPKADDYTGPDGYFEYLQTVKKKGTHGAEFNYRTINSDAIGWVISRTTGKSVDELLSERIWQKMGAEQSAYMTVDSKGTPFAGGGVSAGLHDMARIGDLMLNKGEINGKRLFPATVVDHIQAGDIKDIFAKSGYDELKNGDYKSFWWLFDNPTPVYAARGVHGQTVYVDPVADMVIVRFASHPESANPKIDPTSLPAYSAVANYLIRK